jgi:hypothetical protein
MFFDRYHVIKIGYIELVVGWICLETYEKLSRRIFFNVSSLFNFYRFVHIQEANVKAVYLLISYLLQFSDGSKLNESIWGKKKGY